MPTSTDDLFHCTGMAVTEVHHLGIHDECISMSNLEVEAKRKFTVRLDEDNACSVAFDAGSFLYRVFDVFCIDVGGR